MLVDIGARSLPTTDKRHVSYQPHDAKYRNVVFVVNNEVNAASSCAFDPINCDATLIEETKNA